MFNLRAKARKSSSKTSRRAAMTHYRSGPSPSKSPFQKKKAGKQRRFLSQAMNWLIVFIIAAGVVYSLILRAESKIVLSSNAYRPASTYHQATISQLNSLVNRNKLTFDENRLASQVKKQFPEINSVYVSLPFFGQTPTITINISNPSLIFKAAQEDVALNKSFVVDSKGTVVGPSSDFPQLKNLTFITDATGFAARSGTSVLSLSDVNFISTITAQINKAKVPIASLTLPKFAQEIELRTTDRQYFVKFYLGGDPAVQSGQFLSARAHFDQINKQPSNYLDVRVAGKVFYK